MNDPAATPPTATAATSAPLAPRRGEGGGTARHLLGVIAVTLVIAVGIAYLAGAFRPTPRIGFLTSTEDVYWNRVIAGAQSAADQFGVKLEVMQCPNEAAQTQKIREMLDQGYDGIGVSPVNADGQAGLLRDAGQRAAIVTFDSDSPGSERVGFVGTDNYLAGRTCAEHVREAVPDGGEVVVCVGSIQNVNGRDRRQGFIDNLLDRPLDPQRSADPLDAPLKGSKYTIVATLIDDTNPGKAVTLAAETIKAHPNLKCMAGLWSYSVPSILDALKQTDKLRKIKVVGFDETDATLAGVEAGHVDATLVQDQFNMGYDAVRLLIEVVNKIPPAAGVSRTQYLPLISVRSPEDVAVVRYVKERERAKMSGRPMPEPSEAPEPPAATTAPASTTTPAAPATPS